MVKFLPQNLLDWHTLHNPAFGSHWKHFEGPQEHFGGPLQHFGGPQGHFRGTWGHLGAPWEHFGGHQEHFGGPREHFEGPWEHFGGSQEHFGDHQEHFGQRCKSFTNLRTQFAEIFWGCPPSQNFFTKSHVILSQISKFQFTETDRKYIIVFLSDCYPQKNI